MAEDPPSAGEGDIEPSPGPISSFDAEPEETEEEPAPEESGDDWSKSRWTIVGIVLAVVASMATLLVARSILEQNGVTVGTGELIVVGLISLAVGLAAFLPLRWGLWVVSMVAGAHYGLNFYNMLLTDESVYQFVAGDAMGYAVLTPAIGVVLGFVLEGVYRLIAPE